MHLNKQIDTEKYIDYAKQIHIEAFGDFLVEIPRTKNEAILEIKKCEKKIIKKYI